MSGGQGPTVDELAADLIAADVAKTQMAGRPAKTTATPFIVAEQQGPRWLVIGGLGVVLVVVLAGGALALGVLGGGAASPTPTAVSVATATPVPTPVPTPAATPTTTVVPATASPSPTPSPTLTPLAEVNGDSLGFGEFDLISGGCRGVATQYSAPFEVTALDGTLTMNQLPSNQMTSGPVTRTGLDTATVSTTGPDETYEGEIFGTSFFGEYRYTGGGCNSIYGFKIYLARPFLAPPPAGTAPGFFELLNGTTFEQQFQLVGGQTPHLVVASLGDPDIRMLMPIRVILYVGDVMPWNMLIEGDPSQFCRGPTGCSIDAPGPVDPAWVALGQYPLVVAYANNGTPIAFLAQNGFPPGGLPPSPLPQ